MEYKLLKNDQLYIPKIDYINADDIWLYYNGDLSPMKQSTNCRKIFGDLIIFRVVDQLFDH